MPGPAVNWRDVWLICVHARPDSPLAARLSGQDGEDWGWGWQEILLAQAVDVLHVLVWMQTADGRKGRNRPKPIPRPPAFRAPTTSNDDGEGVVRRQGDRLTQEEIADLI
ncbi:DUF5361 domain-containing protein [Trueperella bialowiezensis]|uniref:DUF5361 domain-containing protein n=1 Tax=Trueperella bialowiezensis TaxID=312285 RepID=UPI000F84D2C0|nr:DUF5361 domain-containing protein [Trueperella bialowiezensis]